MAIDASIYSMIRQPEQPNLLQQYAQTQNIQALQDQNKLASLVLAEKQRESANNESLREVVRGFGSDTTQNYQKILGTGNLKAAQDYQKNVLEQNKTRAELGAKEIEAAKKRVELAGQAFGYVRANATLDNAISAINYLGQNGVWTPEQVAQYTQQVQANPGAIQQLADQAYRSALDAKSQLANYETRNLGATTETFATDPVTGVTTVVNSARNTVSPDAQLQANVSAANNQRSTAATREVAQATRDAARISKQGASETELRKEFASLPEVKKYKEAVPAYQAVKNAAKSNNPQADINLIYGLAKLYDPESVVREGEYDTIARSQAIPEWIKGYAQRLVGGGRLTEATKKQILEQADVRLDSYKSELDGARAGYSDIARRNGLDPSNVFLPVGEQARPSNTPAPAAPGAGKFRILGVER